MRRTVPMFPWHLSIGHRGRFGAQSTTGGVTWAENDAAVSVSGTATAGFRSPRAGTMILIVMMIARRRGGIAGGRIEGGFSNQCQRVLIGGIGGGGGLNEGGARLAQKVGMIVRRGRILVTFGSDQDGTGEKHEDIKCDKNDGHN